MTSTTKVLIFLLVLVSSAVASSHLKFNFEKILRVLENALSSGGDIRPALNDFNRETRHLNESRPNRVDQFLVPRYISMKEEIIRLILSDNSIDCKSREISTFKMFLVQELTTYEAYFSPENYHLILSFLFKISARSGNFNERTQQIFLKLGQKLTNAQAREFNKLKNLETKVKISEIDEKVKEFSILTDPIRLFSIICEASKENDESILIDSYEIMVEHLEILDFDSNPDWLVPVLDSLVIFFTRNISSSKFMKFVGNFILSDEMINIIKTSSTFNQSYSLLLYFVFKDSELFASKFESISETFKEYSYYDALRIIEKLLENIQILSILNNDSDEDDFKLVTIAFSNLVKLKNNNEYAKQALSADYEYISNLIHSFTEISLDYDHPLNDVSMMIIGMIGYLGHDLTENHHIRTVGCYSNIVSGFGSYLVKNDPNSCEHVINFINDFLPKVSLALESDLKYFKASKGYIEDDNLQSFLAFCQLAPTIKERNSFSDQIYAYSISDLLPDYNKYITLKDVEIIDRQGVYVSSFLTFLENYVRNPSETQLPYLRDFYLFLKDSKLLTKTEITILENNFNGFKLNYKIKKSH